MCTPYECTTRANKQEQILVLLTKEVANIFACLCPAQFGSVNVLLAMNPPDHRILNAGVSRRNYNHGNAELMKQIVTEFLP